MIFRHSQVSFCPLRGLLAESKQEGRKHLFDAARRLVKIYLRIEVETREDEALSRLERFLFKGEDLHGLPSGVFRTFIAAYASLDDSQIIEKPIKINCTRTRAGHHPIALEIIQSIGIERAGYDR